MIAFTPTLFKSNVHVPPEQAFCGRSWIECKSLSMPTYLYMTFILLIQRLWICCAQQEDILLFNFTEKFVIP